MMLAGKLSRVTLKKGEAGVTGRLGLSWVRHCLEHWGMEEMIDRWSPKAGRSNREILGSRKVMAGALSVIGGAERIEDVEVLRADKGLLESMGWERMISADTLREYLKERRNGGKLRKVNEEMVQKAMRESGEEAFTYDNDATYIDSGKEVAAYSYQGKKQVSGLMGFIAELGVCNTVDYRRGEVSPSVGILNQLKKAVKQAKGAGKRIERFRSDSAAHENKIFVYCEVEGIRYYVSLRKNEAVRGCIGAIAEGQWRAVEFQEGVEYGETVYVTNEGVGMRMLVLRWGRKQADLFEGRYGYHAMGTNDNEIEAMEWLKVHNGRMNSENYHKELKSGLNAGYTPSHDFEMDRGYFLLNVLAYNMLQVLKLFYLGLETRTWTIKTLRYRFFHVCGQIVKTGRRYVCKILNVTQETFALFGACKARLIVASG